MMDTMANHATRVRGTSSARARHRRAVHRRVPHVEHLIDPHSVFPGATAAEAAAEDDETAEAARQGLHGPFVNPPERLDRGARAPRRARERPAPRSRREPTRDVLLFLLRTRRSRTGRRHPRDHPRRELLLRPPGHDQDHERGLGDLLALEAHDRALPRGRRRSCTTPTSTRAWSSCRPAGSTPTRSASRCSRTSSAAGTRGSTGRVGALDRIGEKERVDDGS
jgi:hypothetical protein